MMTIIEIAPPQENYMGDIRRDIRHGTSSVGDVVEQDTKFKDYKKGAVEADKIQATINGINGNPPAQKDIPMELLRK